MTKDKSLRGKIRFAELSNTGMVREHNEDAIGSNNDMGLLVLADGMGGYNAGDVASQLAVETIATRLMQFYQLPDSDVSTVPAVEAANDGIVLLAEYFGIYGNTVVLDHGYGLLTLYGHLSSIGVEVGLDAGAASDRGEVRQHEPQRRVGCPAGDGQRRHRLAAQAVDHPGGGRRHPCVAPARRVARRHRRKDEIRAPATPRDRLCRRERLPGRRRPRHRVAGAAA